MQLYILFILIVDFYDRKSNTYMYHYLISLFSPFQGGFQILLHVDTRISGEVYYYNPPREKCYTAFK